MKKIFLMLIVSWIVIFYTSCKKESITNITDLMIDTSNTLIVDTVEFVYPLTIGSTWTYSYYLYYSFTTGAVPLSDFCTGVHTWQLLSMNSQNDSTIYQLICSKIDTFRVTGQDAIIEQRSVPVTIVITSNTIFLKGYATTMGTGEELSTQEVAIPRFVEKGIDTINTQNATFVSGIGLTNYHFEYSHNSTKVELLKLLSFSIK